MTLALALIVTVSNGQASIENFLGSAVQDPELDLYTNQLDYLSKGHYRLAPIRQIELRTQNNELGSGERQYGLRISPSNPWEVKKNNLVFNSQQIVLSLQKELTFKALLEKRYQLVLDLIFLNEMRTIWKAAMQNTENRISVLERQKVSSSFDPEEFLELKLEQMEEQTDIESFEFKIAQKKEDIRRAQTTTTLQTGSDWTYEILISLPQLKHLVDSLKNTSMFSTRLAYRRGKILLAEHEYALQKNNINLGFFQTEYMPYRLLDESKRPLGISMGINIPLFNPNKGNMAERKLDILEAQSEFTLEKQIAEEEVKTLLDILANSLDRHQKLEMIIKPYNETNTFGTVNNLTQNNPLIKLKLNAQIFKLKKRQLELKNEIYQSYIKLLSTIDLLNQKPLINYLHNQLLPIQAAL
ncbi:TolC family protein [Rufibacter tibetensis]|uniref:hypothetical protein n=1 Tax=Rufibacter tibetensis TaxID=512763 RepID=UPI0012FB6E8D|nr:hypothetical protein [Rufibacter tibetensis]